MKFSDFAGASTRAHLGFAGIGIGIAAMTAVPAMGQGPRVGDPPESKNMRLVGYNDLQARSAYQPVIHRYGNRYIAYVGHHGGTSGVPKPVNPMTKQPEFNGTSVIDVTDPANPKYLAHIPGDEGLGESGGAQMVRICDGKTSAEGRSERGLHAAGIRQQRPRDLECRRSCRAEEDHHRLDRPDQHPQELVGMRYRHRLPRVRREVMAHAPHDRDLRSQRSVKARENPRVRSGRPAARRDRHGADRSARHGLDRREG